MKRLCVIVSIITGIIGVIAGIFITYNMCVDSVVEFNDDVQAYQKRNILP